MDQDGEPASGDDADPVSPESAESREPVVGRAKPRRSARAWASIVLCVVSAVLLAGGTLAGIANRQLVDGSRFAAHVDAVRQDDAVARQVGIAMTNKVIEANPDLVAVRPLIEAASVAVVQSPSVSPMLTATIREVHAAFTQPGSGTVVLRLADIGAVLSGVVAKISPDTAASLPPNLDVTLARIGDQTAAHSTIDLARRVSLLSWLLPLLALLCVVAAAWASGWGERSVRLAGRSLLGAGCLVALVAGVGTVIGSTTGTNTLDGALRAATIHELVGLLWWPAAVLLGAGVVLRVVAALDGAPATSDARDWLELQPSSQRVQGLRAGILVLLGTYVVVRPASAVQAVALLIGLGVLLLGLGEATRILSQLVAEHGSRVSDRVQRWIGRVLQVAPGVVVAGLVISLALPSSRALPAVLAVPNDTRCNGYVELCARPYNQVAYPAAHNSMSAADEPGWFLAEQPTGLVGQLDAGIRVLLIDTWYGQATTTPGQVSNAAKDKAKAEAQLNAEFGAGAVASARRLRNTVSGNPIGPVEPYLCHAVCDIGATKWEPAMAGVRTWLQNHPREVVTFFIEDNVSAADTAKVFEAAGLLPYVAAHEPGRPWPTLGQMIETGKRVVVLMQRDGGGATYPWLLQGWDQAQDTNYDAKTPEQLSCARNRGTDKSQLLLINNWLNNFDRIVTGADQVNAYDSLYPRMLRCQKERGMIPNFVAVNYYNRGDLFRVVNALNRVG